MIRFSLLGSGSSGNAIFVTAPTGKILIDCGLSFRQTCLRLEAIGESLDDLKGVVVTHEHGDHVNGLGVLARRTGVPVYMTHGTRANLPKGVGDIPKVKCFESGASFSLDPFHISSFRVAHDAADPVSYTLSSGGHKLGLACDLGSVSHLVRRRLAGAQALILESNYCHKMIRNSSYPAAIIQRIDSSHGHLSNKAMNALLSDLLHDGLEWVVAVHISQENNTVDTAREMAARVLKDHSAQLYIADQDRPTPMFDIRGAGAAPLQDIA